MMKLVIAIACLGIALTTVLSAKTRGVPIMTQEGKRNYLGFVASGSQENLAKLEAEARKLKCDVNPPQTTDGINSVHVFFNSDVGPRAAVKLVERVEAGKFGQLEVRDLVLPIETLPADPK